jgi:hypothetical protein
MVRLSRFQDGSFSRAVRDSWLPNAAIGLLFAFIFGGSVVTTQEMSAGISVVVILGLISYPDTLATFIVERRWNPPRPDATKLPFRVSLPIIITVTLVACNS